MEVDCRRPIVVCAPDCLILIGAPGIGSTVRSEEVMSRALGGNTVGGPKDGLGPDSLV